MSKKVFIIGFAVVVVLAGVFIALNFSGLLNKETSISYTGSSTIGEHIIPDAFDIFTKQTGLEVGKIENPGTGKGIEAVLSDKAKMAGASRPIDPEEENQGLYKQIIGYDAIDVFVHKSNPVKNLSKKQIKEIFSGKVKNWKEVGGKNKPIVVITEVWGEKRATMIEFQKLAMDGADYTSKRKEVDRPADQATTLANEENGIINVSMAFVLPEIKPVSVNQVQPNVNNIRSGAYLFSRPLILVTKGEPQGVYKNFFDFIISPEGQSVVGKKFATLE